MFPRKRLSISLPSLFKFLKLSSLINRKNLSKDCQYMCVFLNCVCTAAYSIMSIIKFYSSPTQVKHIGTYMRMGLLLLLLLVKRKTVVMQDVHIYLGIANWESLDWREKRLEEISARVQQRCEYGCQHIFPFHSCALNIYFVLFNKASFRLTSCFCSPEGAQLACYVTCAIYILLIFKLRSR